MKRLLPFLLLAAGVVQARDDKLDEAAVIAKWMAGSYSSKEQAEKDQIYFDVRLEMAPAWTDRKDGHWFYVEQTMATALDKPYRQRVYQVKKRDDGKVVSIVYTLPGDALKFAGEWKKPKPLAGIDPKDLKERDGCEIVFARKDEKTFTGSTDGKKCASDLKGASYASSEVTLTESSLTSWDRGFDKADMQVWGAVKGPYIFKRK